MATVAPDDFSQLLARVRPRLHRYCARMAGSALDGEDIVQDAMTKAALGYDALAVRQPEAWLFRIAHNAAMDFLRRRAFERGLFAELDEQDLHALPDASAGPDERAEAAAAALTTFMHLPPTQRSAVILADVLGHALQEIAEILASTVPAVKAALHRGRSRLRELAGTHEEARHHDLSTEDRALARRYAEHFNARDFDGLRSLLADEVKLHLAGRLQLEGKAQVSTYFGNYATLREPLHARLAAIEGRAALWIFEGDSPQPAYAIVLDGREGQLTAIRDFRYARYVSDEWLREA